jgi:hypothetical protein
VNPVDVFSKDGVLTLAYSALEVAASQPELLVGSDQTKQAEFSRGLVQDLATALQGMKNSPFSKQFGAALAAAALKSVANRGAVFFDTQKPWDEVARQTVKRLLGEIAEAIQVVVAPGAAGPGSDRDRWFLTTFLSEEDLTAYSHIFLEQAAKTPEMVLGNAPLPEWKSVFVAVTRAVASQDTILLSKADIMEIAAVAAEEAAKNPTRLFGLDGDPNQPGLAATIIQHMLQAAAAQFKEAGGRTSGTVLFGETLSEAIKTALSAAAGNARAALTNEPELIALTQSLTRLAQRPDRPIGRKEWLFLFRKLAAQALADPTKVKTDEASLLALLQAA